MMRAYTLKILQNLAQSDKPLEDKEIIAWVNEKVKITLLVDCAYKKPCIWQKVTVFFCSS